MASTLRPRSRAALVLGAALVLHNLEEAVAYPRMDEAIRDHLAMAPRPVVFLAMLATVTVLGAGLLAWAALGAERPSKRAALAAFAWVLLANILVPHVPAAIVLGGYAPGLATALLINLPACLLALRLLMTPN